jgi:uncharacterized protein YecA (UPF0149 family)
MGAIAEAFAAYSQPLIDQTDGSLEQLNKALALGQMCYNLALLPEDEREKTLRETQANFGMTDAEFDEFRRSIIEPMIRRHHEMFPLLHGRLFPNAWEWEITPRPPAQPKTPPPADRYAPCPCGSGEKYKFCCGAKRR